MLQSRLGQIDKFVWWDLERISADAGMQYTSTDFQHGYSSYAGRSRASDKLTDRSNLHGERCVRLHTHLWYMQEFRNLIFILY